MAGYDFTEYYYCDEVNGSDANAGTLMTLPFKTFDYALQHMATDGSCLFMRRDTEETKASTSYTLIGSSDHDPQDRGAVSSWPRGPLYVRGRCTKNSYVIDRLEFLASGLTHEARYVDLDDGATHLVCRVVDSDTIWVDPPYTGNTSDTASITFHEDELYDIANGLSALEGADDKAAWDADHDNMFHYQVSGQGGYLYFSGSKCLDKYSIAFSKTSVGAGDNYMMRDLSGTGTKYKNCWFKSLVSDADLMYAGYGSFVFDGCVFDGMATYDSSQYGIVGMATSEMLLINSVMLSMGYAGYISYGSGQITFKNVKMGMGVGSYGVFTYGYQPASNPKYFSNHTIVADCDFSECSTEGIYTGTNQVNRINIINDERVAGDNLFLFPGAGRMFKNDCSDTDVNQRPGGSPYVLDLDWYRWTTSEGYRPRTDQETARGMGCHKIIEQDVVLASGSWAIKYYAQTAFYSTLSSDKIWSEAVHYDGLSYHDGVAQVYTSTESVATRSDADDWDNFVMVSGITLTEDTLIKLRVYYAHTSSSYRTYVDPNPEIISL
jgi:hypothetical protein